MLKIRLAVSLALSFVVAATTTTGCSSDEDTHPDQPLEDDSIEDGAGDGEADDGVGDDCRARVITLQASGGPNWWGLPNYSGAGVSTALLIDGFVYLVDAADGIAGKWGDAGLNGSPNAEKLQQLRAAFITHMHTDHISGLPVLMAQGTNPAQPGAGGPLPVYGPFSVEDTGPAPPGAPPGAGGGTRSGVEEFFAQLQQALSVDLRADPRSFLTPINITLPESVEGEASSATPYPAMDPFVVYEDENVLVTATLVNHFYPSFAYRFDTEFGSVTISGDTARDTNGNLERLARGSDYLLLEVILDDEEFGVSFLDDLYGPPPHGTAAQAFRERFSAIHVDSKETGDVADDSEVDTLILHHLVPPPADPETRQKYIEDARLGFSGRVEVARDLDEYCLD